MTTVRTNLIAGVAAVAAVVVAALWYFALWSPQSHNLAAARKDHAAATAQLAQLNDQAAQLQALLRQVPADTARLAAGRAAVPDTPALDSALKELQATASATGVNVTSVGPSVPPGSATMTGSAQSSVQASAAAVGIPTVTLDLTVQGSKTQILAFVGRLTNLGATHRVFVVDRFSLSGSGTISAALSVRVFYAGQPTP